MTSYTGSGFADDELISTRSSSSASVNSDDEFTKLKKEREKQRRDRLVLKLASSTSGHTNVFCGTSRSLLDAEHLLLTELANTSRMSMEASDRDDKMETDRL